MLGLIASQRVGGRRAAIARAIVAARGLPAPCSAPEARRSCNVAVSPGPWLLAGSGEAGRSGERRAGVGVEFVARGLEGGLKACVIEAQAAARKPPKPSRGRRAGSTRARGARHVMSRRAARCARCAAPGSVAASNVRSQQAAPCTLQRACRTVCCCISSGHRRRAPQPVSAAARARAAALSGTQSEARPEQAHPSPWHGLHLQPAYVSLPLLAT